MTLDHNDNAGRHEPPAMSAQRRVAHIIETYDRQGWHRTGTQVDRDNAEWLASEIAGLGLEPTLEPFALDRVDPHECYVEIGERRLEGVPLFDATFTSAAGVTGTLGLAGSGADIAVVDSDSGAARRREVRESGANALVIATRGPTEGLSLLNAGAFLAPYGPPAIQVDGRSGEWLRERAASGAPARVVAVAERVPTEAYNVTTTVPGSGHARPRLAVNTPRSGWWEVAAERGGGLACWLETMRAVRDSSPARSVFFSANSGHELGFLGMERLVDAHPEHLHATWLHFGANIGAASGTVGYLSASTPGLRNLARRQFEALVRRPVSYAPRSEATGGEMAVVDRRGGASFMSLTNDNAYFHMPEDRYPANVDLDVVAQFAAASAAIALELSRSGDPAIESP